MHIQCAVSVCAAGADGAETGGQGDGAQRVDDRDGPGRHGQIRLDAAGNRPAGNGGKADASGAGARIPSGRAGPVRRVRRQGVPPCVGGQLPLAGGRCADAHRRPERHGAGRRRQDPDHVPRPAGNGGRPEGLPPALPESRVFGAAAAPPRRAALLLHRWGGVAFPCGHAVQAPGGQGAGYRADLRRL